MKSLKEQTEDVLMKLMGDILAANGGRLKELPAEYVRLYNKYTAEWDNFWNILNTWAEAQDDEDNRNHRSHQIILGAEEKNRREIECLERRMSNDHDIVMAQFDALNARLDDLIKSGNLKKKYGLSSSDKDED